MFILSIAASTLGYVIYAACEDIAQYMVFTIQHPWSSTELCANP